LHGGYGSLIGEPYPRDMRLIATIAGLLTLLVLVLPVHP
jgi:hypothetical protein